MFLFFLQSQNTLAHLYPSLGDYMGLEFTDEVIAANMPEYLAVSQVQPVSISWYFSLLFRNISSSGIFFY